MIAVWAKNREGAIMKSIDWKRKLTSRKWWCSVTTFVSMMIVACGGSQSEAAKITALIMAAGSMIAYTIAEGMTDAASVEGNALFVEGVTSEQE